MNSKNKIIVIGLDGATFDVINPMIDAGLLPNLKKLMSEGVSGTLNSTIPPLTPPAWTSFMTGKNPGKTGIYDFFKHLTFDLLNSSSIRSKTLWELLGDKGYKVGVVNVPMTYPPYPVNGFMVSGLGTPNDESKFTYPESLAAEIENAVGKYRVDYEPYKTKRKQHTRKQWVDEFLDIEVRRKKAVKYLYEKDDCDFFMVVYGITDRVQHLAWEWENQPVKNNKITDSGPARLIHQAYIEADNAVGELLSTMDKDSHVVVISDHGFGPLKNLFHTNNWLKEKGFIKLKDINASTDNNFYVSHYPTIEMVLSKLKLGKIASLLPGFISGLKLPIPMKRLNGSPDIIDWEQTKAYAVGWCGGIFVNRKGRLPHGSVETDEDEIKILNEIKNGLEELEDPETGEKILEFVKHRDELYTGPFVQEAPDIVFVLKGLNYLQSHDFLFRRNFSPGFEGTHRMNGIFIAHGKHFNTGENINSAEIIDVLPTLFYLLNEDIPTDVDGKVLLDIFQPEFTKNNPIKMDAASSMNNNTPQDSSAYSEEDEEEIRARLKHLGYLS